MPTDTIVTAVIQKHQQRATTGHEKYGVTMDRDDLTFTQWLTHLQEELMDAAVYVERIKRDHEQAHGQAYLDGQNSVLRDIHRKLGLGDGASWEAVTKRIAELQAGN